MNYTTYRWTRAAILLNYYYFARENGSNIWDSESYCRMNQFSDIFVEIALKELSEKKLISKQIGEERFNSKLSYYEITAVCIVRIEEFLDESDYYFPSKDWDEDGDQIGPTPQHLIENLRDLAGFEKALRL